MISVWGACPRGRALHTILAIVFAGCRTPQSGSAAARVPMSPDSLQLTLTTDKPAYRAGEPIELILKLTNRSPRPAVLEFSSSQRYDFEIAEWHWSGDRLFA